MHVCILFLRTASETGTKSGFHIGQLVLSGANLVTNDVLVIETATIDEFTQVESYRQTFRI